MENSTNLLKEKLKAAWIKRFNDLSNSTSPEKRIILQLYFVEPEFDKFWNEFNSQEPITTNKKTSGKDKTKYLFKGKLYGKGRLVEAVIRHLAITKTYDELNTLIPDSIGIPEGATRRVSRYGIFQTVGEAKRRNTSTQNRYFFDTPIKTTDNKKIVVCSQWGIRNINKFISNIEENTDLGIDKIGSN
jgi:hypothetical protein